MILCTIYCTIWILSAVKLSSSDKPALLSTSKDIRIVDLTNMKASHVIIKDLEQIHTFSYCYKDSIICWASRTSEKVKCFVYNSSRNITIHMNMDRPSVEGLACDWLTKKIYLTDGIVKNIKVFSLEQDYFKVLFWKNIDQPKGIAVDPTNGLLFWTDWGIFPKIEKASMNGDPISRKIIIRSGLSEPSSITLDIEKKRIYWIDFNLKKIETSNYNGNKRTILLQEDIRFPFSLTQIHNTVYWTDWRDRTINAYNYVKGGSILQLLKLKDSYISIKAWDSSDQPHKPTPCDINNGGCSHLCLLSSISPGYSCACPAGISNFNSTTCQNDVQRLLLVTQSNEINTISLETSDYTKLNVPLKHIKRSRGIDYDPVEKFFYWSDDKLKNIRKAKLDGSGQEDVISLETDSQEIIFGISIDWIGRNLYFINKEASRIEVLSLYTKFKKAVIIDDIRNPWAIAVSPYHGWLYWSDFNEKKSKIERSDLDGSERIVIVKNNLYHPSSITIDHEENKIYWGDTGYNRIEFADFDGGNRKELISENFPYASSLTIMGNHLYWADKNRKILEMVDKITGLGRQIIQEQLRNTMHIKAIDTKMNVNQNSCSKDNGGCQQICFQKSKNKVICSCQIEYQLLPDEKNCVLSEAYLILHSDHLKKIDIQNNSSNDIPIVGTISTIDIDVSGERVYWADNRKKTINRAFLNGSQTEIIIDVGIDFLKSLAIDWLSSNLYWIDTGSKKIEVAELNGEHKKTLFWKNLKQPNNLVLDPITRFMFWSEWDGRYGGIYRASMDGSNKMLLLSNLGEVNGMTIDHSRKFLYWTMYKNKNATIEMCDYYGEQRDQIFKSYYVIPMKIAQYDDEIFWIYKNKNSIIIRANKFNGQNLQSLEIQETEIINFKIVRVSKQTSNKINHTFVKEYSDKNYSILVPYGISSSIFIIAVVLFLIIYNRTWFKKSLLNCHNSVVFVSTDSTDTSDLKRINTNSASHSYVNTNDERNMKSHSKKLIGEIKDSISVKSVPEDPPPSPADTFTWENCWCDGHSMPTIYTKNIRIGDNFITNYACSICTRHDGNHRNPKHERDQMSANSDSILTTRISSLSYSSSNSIDSLILHVPPPSPS